MAALYISPLQRPCKFGHFQKLWNSYEALQKMGKCGDSVSERQGRLSVLSHTGLNTLLKYRREESRGISGNWKQRHWTVEARNAECVSAMPLAAGPGTDWARDICFTGHTTRKNRPLSAMQVTKIKNMKRLSYFGFKAKMNRLLHVCQPLSAHLFWSHLITRLKISVF